MEKSTHTPGPWSNPSDKNLPQHIIHHEGVNGYSPVCYMHLHNDPQLTKANAKLIAAAPELLEKLQQIVNVFSDTQADSVVMRLMKEAEQVIKKATE